MVIVPARAVYSHSASVKRRPASHLRQPGYVALHIMPAHVNDRLGAIAHAAIAYFLAGTKGNAYVPVRECHVNFGHRKWLGNFDLMLRPLVRVSVRFGRWRTHCECASRHNDHFGAVLRALTKGHLGL